MKRSIYAIALAMLIISSVGCSKDPSTTSADSMLGNVAEKFKPEPKTTTVPAGTKLRVALLNSVSSDKSEAGDQFMASLTEPGIVSIAGGDTSQLGGRW